MSALMLASLSTELQPVYVECGILALAGKLTLNIDMLTRVIIFTSIIFSFFFSWVFLFPVGGAGFFGGMLAQVLKKKKRRLIFILMWCFCWESAPHYPVVASTAQQRRSQATCELLMFCGVSTYHERLDGYCSLWLKPAKTKFKTEPDSWERYSETRFVKVFF